jgi:hypothetical protein
VRIQRRDLLAVLAVCVGVALWIVVGGYAGMFVGMASALVATRISNFKSRMK